MNKNIDESYDLSRKLVESLSDIKDKEVVLCPPFVNLQSVKGVLEGSDIKLGAQNVYFKESGAYTGEISPEMLKAVGCEYVIVGHSERREYFKEEDNLINAKIKAVLQSGMKPIFCIGETLEERESGILFAVVERQLRIGLLDISEDLLDKIVIAYEPVWAIGTGKVATNEQAQEMHELIRGNISSFYNETIAQNIRIQYGGSMKPENARELLACPDIDGGLIGGASLEAGSFEGIIRASL